jgi:hypothetical protein
MDDDNMDEDILKLIDAKIETVNVEIKRVSDKVDTLEDYNKTNSNKKYMFVGFAITILFSSASLIISILKTI